MQHFLWQGAISNAFCASLIKRVLRPGCPLIGGSIAASLSKNVGRRDLETEADRVQLAVQRVVVAMTGGAGGLRVVQRPGMSGRELAPLVALELGLKGMRADLASLPGALGGG